MNEKIKSRDEILEEEFKMFWEERFDKWERMLKTSVILSCITIGFAVFVLFALLVMR